jgi:hypothetical protein
MLIWKLWSTRVLLVYLNASPRILLNVLSQGAIKLSKKLISRVIFDSEISQTQTFTETRAITQVLTLAQLVRRWLLTAQSRIHDQISPCGICGGQSCTGTGFSTTSSVFPCQYHSTAAPSSHNLADGQEAQLNRQSQPITTNPLKPKLV